jgi:hypothetical protein
MDLLNMQMFRWLWFAFPLLVFLLPYSNLFFQGKNNAVEVLLGLIVIAGIYVIFHFDPKYKTGNHSGSHLCHIACYRDDLIRQFVQKINCTNHTYLSTKRWIHHSVFADAVLFAQHFPHHISFPV